MSEENKNINEDLYNEPVIHLGEHVGSELSEEEQFKTPEDNPSSDDFSDKKKKRFKPGKVKRVSRIKDKEKSVKNFRFALILACVIIATSIISSSVSYQLFDYYSNRGGGASNKPTISFNEASKATSEVNNPKPTIIIPEGQLTISQVNIKVRPSVVFVGTSIKTPDFFGRTQSVPGSGSGIIISEDGYIVTNHHVIDSADSVMIKLFNGETYDAKLVGSDSQADLAVLKIKAKDLSPAELGDSSSVLPGDIAVAIGNPLGTLEGSITAGIISALDRSITIDGYEMNLMQTDAAVNPGNSGGALANIYGQVIGIVNAKTSSIGVEGLGYAIPIDGAKKAITDLIEKGYVTGRIVIGITTQNITKELADYYNLPEGVRVIEVSPGSPADKAGIKPDDIIKGIDGKDIETSDDILEIRDSHEVGDSIKILLIREGRERVVTLIFEENKT